MIYLILLKAVPTHEQEGRESFLRIPLPLQSAHV